MDEIMEKLEEIEERIEALESKVYSDERSDILVCGFGDIVERRWKDKGDRTEKDAGFSESCEEQECVTCPEDTGSAFNVCGPPELVKKYFSFWKKS